MKKIVVKSEPVFVKEGIPRFLTSFLIELEDRVNEMYADKAFKKSASPTNAKALNSMKQGLKKWFSMNEDQAARVAAFRANPKLAEEEDVKPTVAKKGGVSKGGVSGGVSSAASGAKSGLSGKDDTLPSAAAKPRLVGRAKWLKRADRDDSSSSSSEDENDTSWLDDDDDEDGEEALVSAVRSKKAGEAGKKGGKKGGAKHTAASAGDESEEEEQGGDKKADEKAEEKKEKPQEWTPEKIDVKLKELVARRGTRNYDRVKQVILFAFLLERSKEKGNSTERNLRIQFALVDALFDVNTNMYAHMNVKLWKYAYNTMSKIFETMAANVGKIEIVEIEPIPSSPAAPVAQEGPVLVRGLILSQLERLDEEYFKSLQLMDPHTQDYVARMRHEPALLKLLKLGFEYFEMRGEEQKAASLAARRLDHLYYRRETEGASQRAALREAQRQMASEMQEAQMVRDRKKNEEDALRMRESSDSLASSASGATAATLDGEASAASINAALNPIVEIADEELNVPISVSDETNLVELVPKLCGLVYKSSEERLRIRAVLQHIYHLALHDKYFEARDRMLATRMQEEIANANDITMHITFNRSLVQLGLAAFRKGRIADAHYALAEIVGPRAKELLAQGINVRNSDRTAEQEKLEKRRQMPYPMHINIDLLEFVYLTSAMLLEVPNMAANAHDPRKRVLSKTFRKTLENSERQTFTGPPENTKDHVIAASKALIQADWQQCANLLLNLDIWKLIPRAEDVKTMLKRKIQEEAMRTHLFSNAPYYETIKLEQLVEQFQLQRHSAHAIVSRMMIHDELAASWDQPSDAIIMNGLHTPSHLQHLALQYADRIAAVFDNSDSQDGQSGGSQRSGGSGSQQGGSGSQSQQGGSGGSSQGGGSGGYSKQGQGSGMGGDKRMGGGQKRHDGGGSGGGRSSHHHHHGHHGHHDGGGNKGGNRSGGGGQHSTGSGGGGGSRGGKRRN